MRFSIGRRVAMLTMFLTMTAHADGAANADAKDHDARAAKLEAAGLFERAEAEYLAAFHAAARASDLTKVAEMQEKRGAQDAAADTYAELATKFPKDAVGRAAARKLKALDPKLGKLDLHVSENDATIELRDRVDLSSPLVAPIHLTPGRHRIVIHKNGFERFARDVGVTAGETAMLDVKLDPFVATGHIAVRDRSNANVHVLIDGSDVGAAPLEADIAPGEHRVELVGPKDRAAATTIIVTRRATSDVVLASSPVVGRVRFRVTPIVTQIFVDGVALQHRALEAELAVGDHTVVAKADGYASSTMHVHVDAAALLDEEIILKRAGESPDEISDASGAREPKSAAFHGGFAEFGFFQSTTVSSTSVACTGDSCSSGLDIGGGLRVGGGYAFGAFEIEAGLLAAVSHRGNTVNHLATSTTPAYEEDLSTVVARGMFGIGPRLRSPTQWFQVDAGLLGGIAFGFFGTTRNVTDGYSDQTKDSQTMFAPGGVADLKFIFGKTPGPRFTIGVAALADFPGQLSTSPTTRSVIANDGSGTSTTMQVPSYRLVDGPEFIIGPTLGFVTGH